MDATTVAAIIEEEAALLERLTLPELAAKMRTCTTLAEAIELHRDIEGMVRVAQIVRGSADG